MKRNNRITYENCIYILLCTVNIIYSIYVIINSLQGIRIFSYKITSCILLIISIILILIEIFFLIKKINNKLKRILYSITIILFLLVLLDIIILGIIRTIIIVCNIEKRPTSLDPLNLRLAYILLKNYKSILSGVWTTIWLSMAGTIIGLLIGLLFTIIRSVDTQKKDNEFIAFIKKIGRTFVNIYVTLFRGTPMIVQAIIIYYFLPGILSNLFKIDHQILNNILSVGVAGLITVSLNTTAYLTEVLRGGIESLNKGQLEAARSLGMTKFKSYIYVILPQAIKNSLPSIGNEFIINIKDTSVLSVISVMDLFFVIDSINGKNASQDGIFIAAIIYLILTLGISKLLQLIEKKMQLTEKPLPSCN
jgi:putative lysine transport system permease protein